MITRTYIDTYTHINIFVFLNVPTTARSLIYPSKNKTPTA